MKAVIRAQTSNPGRVIRLSEVNYHFWWGQTVVIFDNIFFNISFITFQINRIDAFLMIVEALEASSIVLSSDFRPWFRASEAAKTLFRLGKSLVCSPEIGPQKTQLTACPISSIHSEPCATDITSYSLEWWGPARGPWYKLCPGALPLPV